MLPRSEFRKPRTVATTITNFPDSTHPCTAQAIFFRITQSRQKESRNGIQRARLPALWHQLQYRQDKTARYHLTTPLLSSVRPQLTQYLQDEPESSAWSPSGRPGTFAVVGAYEELWAECDDCENIDRGPSQEGGYEHLAVLGCGLEYQGYSGCYIGAEEMRVRR